MGKNIFDKCKGKKKPINNRLKGGFLSIMLLLSSNKTQLTDRVGKVMMISCFTFTS